MVQHDNKLIAAQPRNRVGLAHAFQQPRGDFPQQIIAYVVAKTIVDELETIQVEKGNHGPALLALRNSDRLRNAVQQQVAVRQPRQRIVVCLLRQLRLELLCI